MSNGLAIIFAGGGSGGHVFPALAIRERVLAARADARTIVVCSEKEIDRRILEQASGGADKIDFRPIPARPFSLRPLGLLRLARNWGKCVREARALIRELRTDFDVRICAVGGYVSAPVVQAARVEGAPVTLVNLDAAPGLANRWAARHAERVFTAARLDRERTGWELIRPVVRSAAFAPGDAAACRKQLELEAEGRTLVVLGGSQGARTVNLGMLELARREPGWMRGMQILHQTGGGFAEADDLAEVYEKAGVHARIVEFVEHVGAAWGAADAVVSRAGAGSVAEAWANATPTVFLPYPFHKDEHQRRNAGVLEEAGGAVVLRDAVDPLTNAETLDGALERILSDPNERGRMARALRGLGSADGADRIAEALVRG